MMSKLGAFLAYVTLLAPIIGCAVHILRARKPAAPLKRHGKRSR